MTAGTFFALLAVFLSAQFFAQLFSIGLEWLLNLMGLSAMAALEAASITSTGVSMFLYVTILGPISEELLFRGVLLRLLKPWGKQTAIVVSALMFGIFHGNIIQIPFAFASLVLVYELCLLFITKKQAIFWPKCRKGGIAQKITKGVFTDRTSRAIIVTHEIRGRESECRVFVENAAPRQRINRR